MPLLFVSWYKLAPWEALERWGRVSFVVGGKV